MLFVLVITLFYIAFYFLLLHVFIVFQLSHYVVLVAGGVLLFSCFAFSTIIFFLFIPTLI